MLSIVPQTHRKALTMAIAKGDIKEIKHLIEEKNIDVNAFMDDETYDPILMKVLLSYGFSDTTQKLEAVRYMLEKGANPNIKSKSGYNCLHIAVHQETFIDILSLFLDFGGDVNIPDSNGATVAYWVIQSFPWRKEGAEREVFLNVMKKTIMLGADLDYANKFGVTPRKWMEDLPDDAKQLIQECEQQKPIYTPSHTIQPVFPSNLAYPDIAQTMWKKLVPPQGQAQSVQGELLRAVEKLRDEAHRNGNVNYSKSHTLLANFIKDTLVSSMLFNATENAAITSKIKEITKAKKPYLEDDIYDYLTDRICEFYLKNPELIAHPNNPDIHC